MRNLTKCLLPAMVGAVTVIAPAQGPLFPDSAPGSLMKSLDQVEPRTPIAVLPFEIGERGSYYLTGDVVLTDESGGSDGIVITASEVTLDLGGFTMTGGSGNAISLVAEAGQRNITIRNGTLRDWGGSGIDGDDDADVPNDEEGTGTTTAPADFSRTGVVVENVTVADCGGAGITLGGHAVVRNCLVYNVPMGGVLVRQGSRIADCRVYNIGAAGIVATAGSVVTGSQASNCSLRDGAPPEETAPGFLMTSAVLQDCQASNNGNAGFALTNSTAGHCRAFNNQAGGFLLDGGTLTNCSASSNAQAGFAGAGADHAAYADFLNCTARGNAQGFVLLGGSLQNCTAAFNNNEGFNLTGLQATGCASTENDGEGFVLAKTRLSDSQSVANARNGILADADNRITGCHITDNGGAETVLAGLRITGNRNHVSRNHLTRTVSNSDYGIRVLTDDTDPAEQNVIIQNTALGFSDAYDVDDQTNIFGEETAGLPASPQSSFLNFGEDLPP